MNDGLRSYPDGGEFTGTIGDTRQDSDPAWPVPPTPPDGAPNIMFIVLDDLGYAQLGCYSGLGGRIRTPHLDSLAAGGLRYRNFHTTALCSPTRAALLTGRNHHSVGAGVIMERATGFPGYNGRLPHDSAMVPKVLGQHGYATYCLGKWHLTPDEHNGPTGPFDRWPLGHGFQRFYGFLPGETDQWHPDLWADNHRVDPPATDSSGDSYHLSVDLADTAITWLNEHHTIDPSRPFFLHFATGAPHSPHHAPQDIIDSYAGMFDDGWDAIREETFAHQLELGVVPPGTDLPPRNQGVRAWDSLSDVERRVYTRQMEVYAAFVEHTDAQIGRVLDHLRATDVFDDTLIFFLSDNGASAEGGTHGLLSEITYFNGLTETLDDMVDALDDWGGPTTYPHYAAGWAYAGSTPQKWYKSFVHEGGTRDPMIVSWPNRIAPSQYGDVRDQFHHVVDIATTIYELIGIEPPSSVNGIEQRELEGTSLAYTFDEPDAPTRKDRQYFEMFAHRAIWKDGWKAVTMHPARGAALRIGDPDLEIRMGRFDEDVWELYHLADDFSEAHDLAVEHPEKLAELQRQWWEDARRYNVLPLDDRVVERSAEARPRIVAKRDVYRFTSPIRLVRSVSPSVINRDHHLRAKIDVPDDGASGVLISNGGMQGGYTLCLDEAGHFVYVSNYLGHEVTVVRSPEPVPPGHVVCEMAWSKTGPFAGDVALTIGGDPVAGGQVERTNPVIYAIAEGLEIGSDTGTPVWSGYESPARFTGTIIEVALNTRGHEYVDHDAEDRIARYVQ
jgi:arylsulfatase A-like enzyme